MRPLDSSSSDSESSDDENPQLRSQPSRNERPLRRPRTLELIKVLKKSKDSQKTFLVRSVRTEEPNLHDSASSDYSTEPHSMGEPSEASRLEMSRGLRKERQIKVAKVFDKSDLKSLSKLNHVMSVRQKLVGKSLCLSPNFKILDVNRASLLQDSEG
jgi:hypothetical protein